jgi:hypothetical protein
VPTEQRPWSTPEQEVGRCPRRAEQPEGKRNVFGGRLWTGTAVAPGSGSLPDRRCDHLRDLHGVLGEAKNRRATVEGAAEALVEVAGPTGGLFRRTTSPEPGSQVWSRPERPSETQELIWARSMSRLRDRNPSFIRAPERFACRRKRRTVASLSRRWHDPEVGLPRERNYMSSTTSGSPTGPIGGRPMKQGDK